MIFGTPDKVADELLAFRETIGEFGTLLYAGHDWTDPRPRPAVDGPDGREGAALGQRGREVRPAGRAMNRFTVDAQGARLSARIDGQQGKPWLLLSNSLAADLHMWDDQIDVLTPTHRVLRYDTRGHGSSTAPQGPYDFDLLVADIARRSRPCRRRDRRRHGPLARRHDCARDGARPSRPRRPARGVRRPRRQPACLRRQLGRPDHRDRRGRHAGDRRGDAVALVLARLPDSRARSREGDDFSTLRSPATPAAPAPSRASTTSATSAP